MSERPTEPPVPAPDDVFALPDAVPASVDGPFGPRPPRGRLAVAALVLALLAIGIPLLLGLVGLAASIGSGDGAVAGALLWSLGTFATSPLLVVAIGLGIASQFTSRPHGTGAAGIVLGTLGVVPVIVLLISALG